jgi:hypothetical protein
MSGCVPGAVSTLHPCVVGEPACDAPNECKLLHAMVDLGKRIEADGVAREAQIADLERRCRALEEEGRE